MCANLCQPSADEGLIRSRTTCTILYDFTISLLFINECIQFVPNEMYFVDSPGRPSQCVNTKVQNAKYKNTKNRETQSVWERRAPLGPQHVRQLVKKGIKVCTLTCYIHGQYCFSFPENISLPTINLQAWSILHSFIKPFNLFLSLSTGVGSAFQPTCLPHEDVRWRRSKVQLEVTIWWYLLRTKH